MVSIILITVVSPEKYTSYCPRTTWRTPTHPSASYTLPSFFNGTRHATTSKDFIFIMVIGPLCLPDIIKNGMLGSEFDPPRNWSHSYQVFQPPLWFETSTVSPRVIKNRLLTVVLQRCSHERDQLSLRSQEIALKTSCSGVNQGSDQAMPP